MLEHITSRWRFVFWGVVAEGFVTKHTPLLQTYVAKIKMAAQACYTSCVFHSMPYTCTYAYAYIYAYIHIDTDIPIRVRILIHLRIHMHVYIHVHMNIHGNVSKPCAQRPTPTTFCSIPLKRGACCTPSVAARRAVSKDYKNNSASENQLGGLSRQAPGGYIPLVTVYIASVGQGPVTSRF